MSSETTSNDNLSQLRDLYYNPKTGLLSKTKLYQKAKSLGLKVTNKIVADFLNNQEVSQVTKQRRIKHYFPLHATESFERIQIDLLDMSSEAIRGFKWIFCCIDVFTKYAFVYPMKSKSETQCLTVYKEIIAEIMKINGFPPRQCDSDNESAFLSKNFKKFNDDYGIVQHLSDSGDFRSKGVVERFNRTLRAMINKYKIATHSNDWVVVLPDLIYNYNHTIHRTITKTPESAITNNSAYEISKLKQANLARNTDYNNKDNYGIGDRVRLKIKKGIFDKEGNMFTKSVHTIESVNAEGRYKVSDRVSLYKPYELLRVDNVEQFIPQNESEKKMQEDEKAAEQKEKRITRRMNKEGISKDTSNEKEKEEQLNNKALRRYKPRTDLGFNILY